MQALLAGDQPDVTPQWLMAFANHHLAENLTPPETHYRGYSDYPLEGAYPRGPMGPELLAREQAFNEYIDRCAFPVGWGANAAFGHGGPGEFSPTAIESDDAHVILEYETGAKKEIRFQPHNQHTFYLPVRDAGDLDALELPDPEDPRRYEGLAEDVAWAKDRGLWTIGWVNGLFSAVHYFLREYQEFLMDLILNVDLARALLEKVGQWNLAAARKLCEAGVDCVGLCDDLGSGEAMLMSPDTCRELVLPWHRRLCEAVHECGAVVHLHSHGAILPVAADLAEAGVDILNPIDPDDKMPMEEVRQAVGPKVVLCGGMNKHFFDWSKDEQAAHLRQVVQDGRRLGPHILMDSGGLPQNVTPPWFDWFRQTSRAIRTGR